MAVSRGDEMWIRDNVKVVKAAPSFQTILSLLIFMSSLCSLQGLKLDRNVPGVLLMIGAGR